MCGGVGCGLILGSDAANFELKASNVSGCGRIGDLWVRDGFAHWA